MTHCLLSDTSIISCATFCLLLFAFETDIQIILLPYQEREPGATAWALRLLNQILQGLSRGNVSLILLQPNAVARPRLLPFVPAIL